MASSANEHWSEIPPSESKFLESLKRPHTRFGYVVQRRSLLETGRFIQLPQDLPQIWIEEATSFLGVASHLVSGHCWGSRSDQRIRDKLREQLGYSRCRIEDEEALVGWLAEHVLPRTSSLPDVVTAGEQQLKVLKIVCPSAAQMQRGARTASRLYEETFASTFASRLPAPLQEKLDALLEDESVDSPNRSVLIWLKRRDGPVGIKPLNEELDKLERLRQTGISVDLLRGLSTREIRDWRRRAATEHPSELRVHSEAVRHTLLGILAACLLREIFDAVVELVLALTHRLKSRAERKVTKEYIQQIPKVSGKMVLLCGVAKASLDAPEGSVREVVYPVASPEVLRNLIREFSATPGEYRLKIVEKMSSAYAHHYRNTLLRALSALSVRSNNEMHRPVLDALKLVLSVREQRGHLFAPDLDVPLASIVSERDQQTVIEQDSQGRRRIKRHEYELCLMKALRRGMRCKELWVAQGERYRNPDEDLPSDFSERRQVYYALLNQNTDAKIFIRDVREQLTAALNRFASGLASNPDVKVTDQGRIVLSKLEPQPLPERLQQIKHEVQKRWGMISLLDILKEADLRTEFTQVFKSAGTRTTIEPPLLRKRLLLCLFALGTNLGIKRVVAASDSESVDALAYIQSRFITADQMREAIRIVVNATLQARERVLWGEATTCASDSRRFEAWDQNVMTEWHARYGGPGVMIYWHVEKKATCIYSQIKRCSSSEAAAMIEGVLRHCTEMSVDKQYVDTHGQSQVAFAFSHLLGLRLQPRLAGISHQKIAPPQSGAAAQWPQIASILTGAICWERIEQQYDEMIKYTTALKLGTAQAEAILRRFTRDNVKHPTYMALSELGKALKSTFLCDYFNSRLLRREIHEGLNVVENWNSANDFIFFGKGHQFSTNSLERQELGVLALHLLQSSMVFVNTLLLQRVIEQDPLLSENDRRALTPLIYEHINPYGSFELDMEENLAI